MERVTNNIIQEFKVRERAFRGNEEVILLSNLDLPEEVTPASPASGHQGFSRLSTNRLAISSSARDYTALLRKSRS